MSDAPRVRLVLFAVLVDGSRFAADGLGEDGDVDRVRDQIALADVCSRSENFVLEIIPRTSLDHVEAHLPELRKVDELRRRLRNGGRCSL